MMRIRKGMLRESVIRRAADELIEFGTRMSDSDAVDGSMQSMKDLLMRALIAIHTIETSAMDTGTEDSLEQRLQAIKTTLDTIHE
jgi:hypothetical protein